MHETIERYRQHTKDVQSDKAPVVQNVQVDMYMDPPYVITITRKHT